MSRSSCSCARRPSGWSRGTHSCAADHHRRTAILRDAEADAATTAVDRERLRAEANECRALVDALDEQAAELEELDAIYHRWYLHTAGDRAAAEISQMILEKRHAADEKPDLRVTAEEWLAAEHADRVDGDADRPITEHDITEHDITDVTGETVEDVAVEQRPDPELREIAAQEPAQRYQDIVRTPDPGDVADSARRARRAVAEIEVQEVENARADEQTPHVDSIDVDDDADVDDYPAA